MPLISGAFVHSGENNKSSSIQKLIAATRETVDHSTFITYEHRKQRVIIAAGRRSGDSSAEQVFSLTNGLFVGRIYDKNSCFSATASSINSEQIKKTKGESLSQQFWGRYTGALFDSEKQELLLFSDPQGLAQLFYINTPEATLFSSDISVLYDSLQEKPTIDWTYFSSFIAGHTYITSRTPFNNVTELFPGTGVIIKTNGEITSSVFWDPTKIKSPYITNEKAVINQLAAALIDSLKSWTNNISGICLELSGGLDSSALLILLKKILPSDKKLLAIHRFHPLVATAQEIEFARQVSSFCGVQLIESDWSTKPVLTEPQVKHRISKPISFLMSSAIHEETASMVQSLGDYELMSGHGGDHLFLAPPPLLSLTDYVLDKNIKGLSQKISELSAYYRMPFWTVFCQLLTDLYNYSRGKTYQTLVRFNKEPWMTAQFLDSLDLQIFIPPFIDSLRDLYPGKIQHVLAVYQAGLYADHGVCSWNRPILCPLLSQPVVELALSIPTYQSYAHGYNRIFLRQAVEAIQPNKFVWRKSKGGTTGVFMLAIRDNIKRVCELALEGRLARQGFLNTQKLAQYINTICHAHASNLWPLINILAVELWFEAWNLDN